MFNSICRLRNNTVNSAVISFSLFPDQPKKIEPPLEVTFQVLNVSIDYFCISNKGICCEMLCCDLPVGGFRHKLIL